MTNEQIKARILEVAGRFPEDGHHLGRSLYGARHGYSERTYKRFARIADELGYKVCREQGMIYLALEPGTGVVYPQRVPARLYRAEVANA